MKSKIKKILISFVLIIFVNFVSDLDILFDFGMIRPDIGLLYVLGLFLIEHYFNNSFNNMKYI